MISSVFCLEKKIISFCFGGHSFFCPLHMSSGGRRRHTRGVVVESLPYLVYTRSFADPELDPQHVDSCPLGFCGLDLASEPQT